MIRLTAKLAGLFCLVVTTTVGCKSTQPWSLVENLTSQQEAATEVAANETPQRRSPAVPTEEPSSAEQDGQTPWSLTQTLRGATSWLPFSGSTDQVEEPEIDAWERHLASRKKNAADRRFGKVPPKTQPERSSTSTPQDDAFAKSDAVPQPGPEKPAGSNSSESSNPATPSLVRRSRRPPPDPAPKPPEQQQFTRNQAKRNPHLQESAGTRPSKPRSAGEKSQGGILAVSRNVSQLIAVTSDAWRKTGVEQGDLRNGSLLLRTPEAIDSGLNFVPPRIDKTDEGKSSNPIAATDAAGRDKPASLKQDTGSATPAGTTGSPPGPSRTMLLSGSLKMFSREASGSKQVTSSQPRREAGADTSQTQWVAKRPSKRVAEANSSKQATAEASDRGDGRQGPIGKVAAESSEPKSGEWPEKATVQTALQRPMPKDLQPDRPHPSKTGRRVTKASEARAIARRAAAAAKLPFHSSSTNVVAETFQTRGRAPLPSARKDADRPSDRDSSFRLPRETSVERGTLVDRARASQSASPPRDDSSIAGAANHEIANQVVNNPHLDQPVASQRSRAHRAVAKSNGRTPQNAPRASAEYAKEQAALRTDERGEGTDQAPRVAGGIPYAQTAGHSATQSGTSRSPEGSYRAYYHRGVLPGQRNPLAESPNGPASQARQGGVATARVARQYSPNGPRSNAMGDREEDGNVAPLIDGDAYRRQLARRRQGSNPAAPVSSSATSASKGESTWLTTYRKLLQDDSQQTKKPTGQGEAEAGTQKSNRLWYR